MAIRRAPSLLLCALLGLPGVLPVLAAGSAPAPAHASGPHVTARPPLQAIPATAAGLGGVQQRMRQCNGQADARKLRDGPRETFVRGCMNTHRGKKPSRAASEPQHRP